MSIYDVIIVGGGPAGVTAAIYAARYKLNALLISKNIGGQILESYHIENWPGTGLIKGTELADKFKEHLDYLKVPVKDVKVDGLQKSKNGFYVGTEKEEKLEAKSLVLAMGTQRRKLTVPGEKEFSGKGVSYCAVCDAPFFNDKTICVVGGGDSAASSAVLGAQHAKKVYILVKDDKMNAAPNWAEQIKAHKNIEIKTSVSIKEIRGSKMVESVVLDNGQEMKTDGVFIEIGSTPATALAKEIGVRLDDRDRIIVDSRQATNVKKVYAAGDITTGSNGFRQIATAVGEGALAANSAYEDLKKK